MAQLESSRTYFCIISFGVQKPLPANRDVHFITYKHFACWTLPFPIQSRQAEIATRSHHHCHCRPSTTRAACARGQTAQNGRWIRNHPGQFVNMIFFRLSLVLSAPPRPPMLHALRVNISILHCAWVQLIFCLYQTTTAARKVAAADASSCCIFSPTVDAAVLVALPDRGSGGVVRVWKPVFLCARCHCLWK